MTGEFFYLLRSNPEADPGRVWPGPIEEIG